MLAELLTSKYAYLLVILILGIGIYMMINSPNLIKKVIGLNMFQSAIFLFFISSAYVNDGKIAVVSGHAKEGVLYANPLPQVVVLTAIVVGLALTAVAMALIIRIYSEYGTINEKQLREVRANE